MKKRSLKDQFFHPMTRLLERWRYPASMPEDISHALGVSFSNQLSFPQFLTAISEPTLKITKLKKYMPRLQAEKLFHLATQKEIFKYSTLFFYYFPEGWLEFQLTFDKQDRLRRIYIAHKDLPKQYELMFSHAEVTSKIGISV